MTNNSKGNAIEIGLMTQWLASRKTVRLDSKRNDHSDDVILIAREIIEHLKDPQYWQELFYSK